jgi:aspartate kinase
MSNPQLIVQKYGGATLADPSKIKQVAKRIFDLHKSGVQVVVVVSAMGQTTNQLIELAHQVSVRPQLRELDMLLSVGERISMSLLSMALNDLGCLAISFTGSQAGILTDDSHVNANIVEVKAHRVEEALKQNKVVILAGFQGVSQMTKEVTTLGRGGSDITAVAMSAFLKADRCEILKDVDCVYTADPKIVSSAVPINQLNYQHLLEMTCWGAKVLHYQSVKLAAEKNITLFVGPAAQNNSTGTLVNHDISFNKKIMLAINSFNSVIAVEFSNSLCNSISNDLSYNLNEKKISEFNSYLQKNQISQAQHLYSKNNLHYFTAPAETLKDISDFEKNQNQFIIKSNLISSVSVTFTQNCDSADLDYFTSLLKSKDIKILEKFSDSNSLHFFVNSKQKNLTIEILHNKI